MMKLEPTAQEIKDQRIYAGWGLTDEEYRPQFRVWFVALQESKKQWNKRRYWR